MKQEIAFTVLITSTILCILFSAGMNQRYEDGVTQGRKDQVADEAQQRIDLANSVPVTQWTKGDVKSE